MQETSRNLNFRRELKLDRVDSIIRSITSSYRTFENYQEHKDKIESHTLEDFATSATSHGDGSIRSDLEELHSLVAPKGGVIGTKGIFELLAHGVQVLASTSETAHCFPFPNLNFRQSSFSKDY